MASLLFVQPAGAVAVAGDSPIGAHSMLQLNSPYSFKQAMFAEAAAMHASAIRLDVAPAMVFGEQSMQPDFSGLDQVMALSEHYNLRVVGDLFMIPPWLAACSVPTDPFYVLRCGTDDITGYRAVISAIVAHADPVIRDWEISNEPDLPEFFSGTPAQYALMLRTAHDAIKAIDPDADVLLGGVSGPRAMGWLAQVFAVPGVDAAHAFDIANIHERARLDDLAGQVAAWKQFLAQYGFTGPLWVTEHGYPSDPLFQSDSAYGGGALTQAGYLTASIPTLLSAGAAKVFVTERDNLTGPYASEGVLGGDVLDPPVADPRVVEKPAFGAVRAIADCYVTLGRDCAGPAPAANPASLLMPATAIHQTTISVLTVSDPGPGPLQLGRAEVGSPLPLPIVIAQDDCSGRLLEPDETCTLSARYSPVRGGAVDTTLLLPSSNGTVGVSVSAVSPSVSILTAPQLPGPEFTPVGRADGVGRVQRLVLRLSNPVSAPVHVDRAVLSGPDARRFRIASNMCAGVELAQGAGCRIAVVFVPTRLATARALLTLRGDGAPLEIPLRARAIVVPTLVLGLVPAPTPGPGPAPAPGPGPVPGPAPGAACVTRTSRSRVLVLTYDRALVSWQLVRRNHASASICPETTPRAPIGAGVGARSTATGGAMSSRSEITVHGTRRYVASFILPARVGPGSLRPGSYRLRVTATAHGARRSATLSLTLLP